MAYEPHPLALKFPPLPDEEFHGLCNDIVLHGLIEPIVLYGGQILDGWHRYQACQKENIEPRFIAYDGDDPWSFVWSKNFRRRHLTLQQRRNMAKEILRQHPERTDRWIANDVGVSHPTIARIREEVETEQDAAPPNGSAEPNPPGSATVSSRAADDHEGMDSDHQPFVPPESAEKPKRVSKAGRKAGGHKPLSAKEKKAAKEQKIAKPKPLTSDRDDWIEAVSAALRRDLPDTLQAIVQLISGYDALIQQKLSAVQRQEHIHKFAKSLGYDIGA